MFFMFFGKGNSAKAQGGIKPVTEMNPVKAKEEVVTVAGYVVRKTAKTIIGKVTDKDGNPVSFASIKIKGTPMGVSADANGAYSLKVKPNSILVFSGASFKDTEVSVGTQIVLKTVMEKSGIDIKEAIITGHRHRRQYYDATFVVKDIETGLPISKAKVVVVESGNSNSDIAFTDNEGKFQAKRNNIQESYDVKIVAEGYKSNEFSIEQTDFKNIKEEWEVLLRRKKTTNKAKKDVNLNDTLAGNIAVLQVKSNSIGKIGVDNIIRLGGITAVNKSTEPLYVVDGNIVPPSSANIKPDDVDNITILQGTAAAALFGPAGANGAIIIATRKAKEIKMKEVVVNSDYGSGCRRTTRGGISYTNTYENSFLGDTIATVKTLFTNAIKVYPNPVPRNTAFSVALKLKQAGSYSMQVADGSGRIFLLHKFNANAKDVTEKIMGDSRWAAGVYYIRVFDYKNQLISKTSFIFE
jgi:TonB-dependent SusC/RagA subfamily outer membrane receptor